MSVTLKKGFLLIADESTGALYPFIPATLAREVYFPDGKSLHVHWNEEISDNNKGLYGTETTTLGSDTFLWETTLFGDDNCFLSTRVVKGIETQTNNNTYEFKIKLPSEFIPDGIELNYDSASITVTEGVSSTFIRKKCLHTIAVEQTDDILTIVVEHFKNIDLIDLSSETYISGEFNITVHMGFHK